MTAPTAFTVLVEHLAPYTPEWAENVCDVRPGTVRRVADEYVAHARVGATIGSTARAATPPGGDHAGQAVNNGWGGYQCCWARTLVACLVGALEVPGGTLGTTVRLNRPPHRGRRASSRDRTGSWSIR